MKALKTLFAALTLSLTVFAAHTAPLSIMTCTKNCDLPDHNGPSASGLDVTLGTEIVSIVMP